MIYLDSIKLIQFYLVEQESVQISAVTGIFGANGVGKSTLLDAVQIAMVGGNARYVSLNAQADEKSTTRSFRSYCLGQYGELPSERARDVANTYITLIWRNSVTQEPITTGICIHASGDTDGHDVVGRYILRGVELSLNDHIDMVDGQPRSREWSSFKHELIQRSKVTGEDPLYKDSDHYIRALLLALRGSGSSVPSFDAFIRSFRFALRMKFDKSVDQIVRHEVLEARPTNIQKFKEVTESFRRLSEIVTSVEVKINDGEKVEAEYLKAAEESRRAVTWGGLKHEVALEEALNTLNLANDKKNNAEQHMNQLESLHTTKEGELQYAKDEEQRFNRLRLSHKAHGEHGTLQNAITQAKDIVTKKTREVIDSIKFIKRVTIDTSRSTFLNDGFALSPDVIDPLNSMVEDKLENISRETLLSRLKPVFKHASLMLTELHKVGSDNQSQLKDARENITDLESALLRVREGRQPLSRDLQRLQTEFHDNGINPMPICDLVQITDTTWQPVIEAYLGRSLDALLVPAHEENKAFRIYRELNGQRAIYGAKVVRESAQRIGIKPAVGSIAELIEGSNAAAVAFIRSRFGDTMRAFSNDEALRGQRTLTQDGMLTKLGEFERYKPMPISQFRIGSSDGNQKEAIQNELTQFRMRASSLEKRQSEIDKLIEALTPVASSAISADYILSALDELIAANESIISLTKKLSESADDEYIRLGEQETYWKKQIIELTPVLNEIIFKMGSAKTSFEQSILHEQASQVAWQQALAAKDEALNNVDYDSAFAGKQWDTLVEKYNNRLPDMFNHCKEHQRTSENKRNTAIQKGSTALGVFQATHKELMLPEDSEDWRAELAWITEILTRLRGTELVQYKEQMQEAFLASQETFRTDVAIALNNNLLWLEQTMNRLNQVLGSCPLFTNGERYNFVRTVRPSLEKLKKFVNDIATFGPSEDLKGEIPEEFKKMLEDKAISTSSVQSPLDDYREFFDFDIEILREDYITKARKVVGHLSKRLGTGSGGEHRAPLYVIAGAALASAYRLDADNNDGVRLILIDEAFNKMDENNIVSTMRYFEELGLQVLMASPGENQGILTTFMHRYYDMVKDAENYTVAFNGHTVTAEAREILKQDLPQFNEELLNEELILMGKETVKVREAG